jgi:hypothetical protein
MVESSMRVVVELTCGVYVASNLLYTQWGIEFFNAEEDGVVGLKNGGNPVLAQEQQHNLQNKLGYMLG